MLFANLNNVLKRITPTKTMLLALDGPGSSAKLYTQRSRRLKKAKKNDTEDKPGELNSCMFTPGTEFMERIKSSLLYYCSQKIQNQKQYENVQFIISGADSSGEGELKILSWIFEYRHFHNRNDRYIIVGMDGDLILLALGALRNNIFILHDIKDKTMFSTEEFYSLLEKDYPKQSKRITIDFIFVC